MLEEEPLGTKLPHWKPPFAIGLQPMTFEIFLWEER
jgi:hypothetical protein